MLTKDNCQAVGVRVTQILCEEREKRGLTKYVVAKRTGLSQQAIGYLERGIKRPSLETVLRVAEGIGVDLAAVLRRAKKEAPLKRSQ